MRVFAAFALACSLVACGRAQRPPDPPAAPTQVAPPSSALASEPHVPQRSEEPQPWDYFSRNAPEALVSALANARMGPDGFGPIRIGMTIEEVQNIVGQTLTHDNMSESDACREWPLLWNDDAVVSIMTSDGRVTRVSQFGQAGINTTQNIAIDASGEAVRAAYPGATRQPAAYDEPPAYELLVWTNADQTRGLRFEMSEEDKVAVIHAGDRSIRYIEGCL